MTIINVVMDLDYNFPANEMGYSAIFNIFLSNPQILFTGHFLFHAPLPPSL